MKTVFFVRHGETEFNREKRLQGWIDSPLSETGLEQGRIVAEALKPFGLKTAWVSPLGRARQTAGIIQEVTGIEIETDDYLREVSFGDFEGNTLPELDRLYPNQWEARQADKWNYRPPNGESNKDAVPRAQKIVDRIERVLDDEPLLIVAHFAINRILLALLAGIEPDMLVQMNVPHDVIYRARNENCAWRIEYLMARESEEGFQKGWLLQPKPENLPMGA